MQYFFSKTYLNLINKSKSAINGVEIWKKYLESFGLGNYLGYDLPIGRPGLIPGSGFYNDLYKGEDWSATNIISNGIGQGEVLNSYSTCKFYKCYCQQRILYNSTFC